MALSRMTEQIGRVLGGRYRLLAPVGAGVSAEVYLADDVRLRRRVAVKLLHAALAGDESFLRRFRAEAQAAAALSHPHIVAVFDWNDDEGTPYIVTEYLGGGSLRSVLDAGHRLTRSQALVVGLEAARALDHAHRQGFVHRDIKPANILFGDEGRLRIADFGLARAIAEAALTEPGGAVLGTARYASPEQARGEPVDGRSDIYSLALVLIEAVTGAVPFAADTTIGTLMARLDNPIEVPDDLGALRPAIEQAGRLEHEARLDAAGFGRALLAAAETLPRPAPLALVGPAVEVAEVADPLDATLMPGAPAPGSGATTAVEPVPPAAATGDRGGRTAVFTVPAPASGAPGGPSGFAGPDGNGVPPVVPLAAGARRRPPWLLPLAIVAAIVAAVALGVTGALLFQQANVPSHTVPQALIGAKETDLADFIGDYGWRIVKQEVRQDGTEPGQILATDPAPGSALREGGTLTVTVSLGATLVDVPQDLAGLDQEDAQRRLEAASLVPDFVPRSSQDVPEGRVIGLGEDVGPQAPKGGTIQVLVSSGPPLPAMPDVIGWSYDDARDELERMGFEVGVEVDADADGDRGEVLDTDPAAGEQVGEGRTVTLVVAGDGMTLVPRDILGMDAGDAKRALEDAGLRRGSVIGPEDGEVYMTIPPPGSAVREGARIDLLTR